MGTASACPPIRQRNSALEATRCSHSAPTINAAQIRCRGLHVAIDEPGLCHVEMDVADAGHDIEVPAEPGDIGTQRFQTRRAAVFDLTDPGL